MLSNFNMEFIQAFNPLYAVPIVVVIFCALIVYTLGFKSPIQPPSFEGLEEDKKSSKKRKTKEIQKQSKLITNGKVNGIATSKGKVQEIPRKKEVADSSAINEKPKNEKTSTDKKAAKKAKSQSEKQQEKRKENVVTEEINDDGWVQHVSKKGKKNRKKEENTALETQSNSNQSPTKKVPDADDVNEADKVPSNHVEVLYEERKNIPEEKPLKKSSKKETTSVPIPEKPVKLEIAVEVKPNENYLEHDLKQSSTNIPTVSEDAGKSKKKKKKQVNASVTVEANSASVEPNSATVEAKSVTAPLVQNEPVSNITDTPQALPNISEPVVDIVPVSVPDDSKTNVLFDELAGLYPEAKEKKKKKVRRDH